MIQDIPWESRDVVSTNFPNSDSRIFCKQNQAFPLSNVDEFGESLFRRLPESLPLFVSSLVPGKWAVQKILFPPFLSSTVFGKRKGRERVLSFLLSWRGELHASSEDIK